MEKAKGDRPVELVRQIEKGSPLAAARLHRQLTVDEAARRAGLTPDEVEWLEAGRVYRFPSADAARILAGLPVAPRPLETVARGRRLVALAAAAAAIAALVAVLIVVPGSGRKAPAPTVPRALLPPAWKVEVDVLNGCGDINYTRQVASHIQALAYRIGRVAKAPHFGQAHTVVYFEPGGEGVAGRLAQQLGVDEAPLPGGSNPNRLVAIVGCPNVAGK